MVYDKKNKYFIKKLFLFLLPCILIFALLDLMLIYSGELKLINSVLNEQKENSESFLYDRTFVDAEVMKYKYKNIVSKKPDVLILGSSRVLQIRKKMFDDSYTFYNAGLSIETLFDLDEFREMVFNDYSPEIVVLGPEPWWFSRSKKSLSKFKKYVNDTDHFYNWRAHLDASKTLLSKLLVQQDLAMDMFRRKDKVTGMKAVGLKAIDGNGFRDDGSRQYGTYILEMRKDLKYVDREGPPIIRRVKDGLDPFYFNAEWDHEKEELLIQFLDFCKKNDILVLGMSLPFSSEVFLSLKILIYIKIFLQNMTKECEKFLRQKNTHFLIIQI